MSIRRLEKSNLTVRAVAIVLCVLLFGSGDPMLLAQDPAAQAAAPEADSGAQEAAPKLAADQIDSLVAPIALYPDPLLSQTLVAATYPIEIIQAGQWLAKNKDLKGEALTAAAEKQNWDPSVQAMVAIPDVIKRMSEDITWTTDLGNAFLDQQDDVMDAVQRLRVKAREAGKLDSTEQQKVETKVVENRTIVEIQPASTQVVYVPTYSPTVIWGPPVYPYPPIYYPPYSPGAAWLGFGVGMAVGVGMSGGWGWGCGWGHGGGNNIYINNNNNFVRNNNIKTGNINVNSGNNNWQHNSNHRGGAPYSNKNTANKYGGSTRGGSASTRQAEARSAASSVNRSGASSMGANRAGDMSAKSGAARDMGAKSGGAKNMSTSRPSGGGDRVGDRSIPKSSSSRGGGSFAGASGSKASASSARASSSRGASSMGRSGSGGRR
jgi:hypothetical protein